LGQSCASEALLVKILHAATLSPMNSANMRQIWITKTGSEDGLALREAPDPQAKAGEVRVRVRASGVNFADLMARAGLYPDAPKLPCVVGYEVSGVVDQVGLGVAGFSEGDHVLALCRFGGYSDLVALPSSQVFKLPAKMSFEAGAKKKFITGTEVTLSQNAGRIDNNSIYFVPNPHEDLSAQTATWWIFTPEVMCCFLGVLGFGDQVLTEHFQTFQGKRMRLYTVVAKRTRGRVEGDSG